MELVNNYFSGSTGTVSRTTGPSGYGPGSDSSGTGGIDFSTLLDAQNVDGKAASGINVTGNDAKGNSVPQTGPARGPANEVKPEALEKKDAGEEIKARTEEDIAVLLSLINRLSGDRMSDSSEDSGLGMNETAAEAKSFNTVDAIPSGKGLTEAGNELNLVNDRNLAQYPGDTAVNASRVEVVQDMEELINGLSADKVTTASGEVELVTGRITTEAKPPSAVASSEATVAPVTTGSDTGNSGGPVASAQNQVPKEDGKSVTVETRNGEDEEAEKKATLETERNGEAFKDTKATENVDSSKMTREEILKSLEGQGKLVTNSTNTPNGTPSMDTNGPTGRPPEEGSKVSGTQTEKGPAGRKTENTIQETKTPVDDPAASMPMSFAAAGTSSGTNAVQSQGTDAAQAANAGTNETMMMRTTETTVADDLTNLLSSRFPAKNGQLTIELDPEKLGKITINVNYDSGHAAVTISATNQKTVELLTQSASAMANIIQQKTGQETNVYIPNTQESGTKQDMASGRESNENAEQQETRQRQQQANTGSEAGSTAFLQQMRLGLV